MNTTIALLFSAMSSIFNLPPGLLSGLCYVESAHNPSAIHHDDGGTDSIGLCQMQLPTARMMGFHGNRSELLKPEINAYWAAVYLKHQLIRYDGDVISAISAYNAGSLSLNAKREVKNSLYVNKVLKAWEAGK